MFAKGDMELYCNKLGVDLLTNLDYFVFVSFFRHLDSLSNAVKSDVSGWMKS